MNTLSLRLDQIVANGRLRAVDSMEVARLAVSMAEVGLLQPVEVMPREDGRFDLVLGGHRLAAAILRIALARSRPFHVAH